MKTILLSLSLAVAGVSTAHAQIYSPTVTRSAVLGGIAGALIGGHNHDRWGEGALIGAAAGALLGAAVEQPQYVPAGSYATSYQPARVVYVNSPPIQYVPVAPAPQVVYLNSYAPAYCAPAYVAPCYVPRAPVVVVNSRGHHRRPQTVVYTRSRGWGRD